MHPSFEPSPKFRCHFSDPPVLGRESDDPLAVEVVAVALGVEGRPYSIEHGIGFLTVKIPSANRRFLDSNIGARKSDAVLGHF